MSVLQVEVGKAYRDSNGYVRLVMEAITATNYDWDPLAYPRGYRFIDECGDTRTDQGQIYYEGQPSRTDFIAEVELNDDLRSRIAAYEPQFTEEV